MSPVDAPPPPVAAPARPRAATRPAEPRLTVPQETAFLVLAGVFLASMTILNVIGVTRILDLSFSVVGFRVPMQVPIGVLPYPITFLCTDLISELFGRRRANRLVWVGLLCNAWLFLILWVGGAVPGLGGEDAPFFAVQKAALGSVFGSMVAYLLAQLCDVHLFHWLKRLTNGRHLWLRNNGSTLISQAVDTFVVLSIAHFYAGVLPMMEGEPVWPQLFTMMAAVYVFKLVFALLDTLPAYVMRDWLSRRLSIDPRAVH